MKFLSHKLIMVVIAALAVGFLMFWNFANTPGQNDGINSARTATTSPIAPPDASAIADDFDRTGTTTFTSKILGIEFDHPLTMGILAEKVLPPDNKGKGGPFERWSVFYTESPVDEYSYFSIRADNKNTALSMWEGCGPMFKYYGQPIENICSTKEFLNTDVYDIELNKCEVRKSDESVPYIYFEAKGISHCEYGKSDERSGVFSFARHASANTLNKWPIYRYTGVFFKTQSDKWPGMSFTVSSIGWSDGAIVLPHGGSVESAALPTQNIQLIKDVVKTLRYAE